ncbi:MAG TPA: Gfo/Idh/MocA family oxidoreductase [Candidatus Pullichristensenella avicola]|nr:Gfo/Idh/MocA family oxidoreductase [Candidatus Pullichristensenella avicola]
MKKIRFGVIGAGGIADRRTIPGMLKCDEAELVSVMEIDAARAEELRAKYGAKRAYTDEAALLADPEIDAVYIASPVKLHARQAMMAADNHKHILLEKPIALTYAEAKQVLDYCDARGVRVAAGFMMRFGACINEMKRAYEAGKIGQLVSIYAQFTCWYPDMPGNWRQSKASGGGGSLTDMGVHMIDLIHYVTGSRTRQVAAFHDTLTFHYEVEDSSNLLLRLENGALCTVQTNFNIPDPVAKWRFEMFGTRGRLVGSDVVGQVDNGEVEMLRVDSVGGYDAQQDASGTAERQIITGAYGDLYQREVASFCESLLQDKPFVADARGALLVQQVIESAYRSNDEGIVVTL